MSTTVEKDETQVSITANGETVEAGSLSEFSDRADEAISRLRGEQLSFNVGLPGNRPEFGSVKIGGSLGVGRDLKYRDKVLVRVLTDDGELLAEQKMTVTGVAFKVDSHGYTDRIHTVSS